VATYLKLVWRNLWRGWRRTAIVVTGIGIGIAAAALMVAWMNGMMFQLTDNAVRTQLAHLAVQLEGYQAHPDLKRAMPERAIELVERAGSHPGVHAAPRLLGDGLAQSARRSVRAMISGVRPEDEARVSSVPGGLVSGEFLPEPKSRADRRLPPVAIGAKMAERLDARIGEKIVLRVAGEGGLGAFRVRGIYRTASSEFDGHMVYLRLSDAQRLFGRPGALTQVAVALDDPELALEVRAWLSSEAHARLPDVPLEVLTWQEREPRLAAMLDVASSTGWIFYGVIFVAMAFGIANVMLMAVFERIREFGVMRSLGLRGRRLVLLIVGESIALTVLGTVAGLALALPISLWLGRIGLDLRAFSDALEQVGMGTKIYFRMLPSDVVTAVALAGATALLAGLWPAWRAARMRPAEALRHT
jgi:ABC-type lipoprotein release transport system permease subunit